MSETLTVQVKEVTSKQGNTNGKAWTRYALVDAGGSLIGSSFESLNAAPGSKVEVTREKKGDFWNITEVKPAAADATVTPAPQPGTGDYIKGKEAPETRAAIAAAVALKEAVNSWTSPAVQADTKLENVLQWADSYFDWLMSKSQDAAPEKPAQDVGEPTQEQRDELKAIVDKLNTMVPKQEGQKSWTEDLAYFAEHTFGKTGDLNRSEFQQLIDYGHGLERDQALPF